MKLGTEEARKYLLSLKKSNTVTLVSHNDVDGISSAAIMNAFLRKRIGRDADDIIIQTMPPMASLMTRLRSYVPDKVIITDLSIVDARIFRSIAKISYPLLIDHHTFTSIPDVKGVYVNPRLGNPDIYQSASYLAYRLAGSIADMSDRIWIAVTGIIGDYDISFSRDLLREARKKYPEIRYDISKLFNTVFGRVGELITAAKAYKKLSLSNLSLLMSRFSSPHDFLASPEVSEYLKAMEIIREEVEKIREEMKHSIQKVGKFVFFHLESKYGVRSYISTMLGERYRDRIVVITEKYRGKMRVSVRNQSKRYDVAELLRKAAEQVGVKEVGGHPAAAGAQVPLDRWEEFRSVLLSLV